MGFWKATGRINVRRSVSRAFVCVFIAAMGFAPQAWANGSQCSAVFDSGVQTHSWPGVIWLDRNAKITGLTNTTLSSYWTINRDRRPRHCNNQKCEASWNLSERLATPSFPGYNRRNRFIVKKNSRATIQKNAPQTYKEVRLDKSSRLTILGTDGYFSAGRLRVGQNAQLTLHSGTYYFDEIVLDNNAKVFTANGANVKLVSRYKIHTGNNVKINQNGQPEQLLLFNTAWGRTANFGKNARVSAFLYSRGVVSFAQNARLTGNISGARVVLGKNVRIATVNAAQLNLPPFCSAGTSDGDLDGDGTPDSQDDDVDGDGFSNTSEEAVGTDPRDAQSIPADLDGDFIPDALDDDRDGDGISNTDEEAAGSNPDDANDYPDTRAPDLSINAPLAITDSPALTLSGSVNDPAQPYSGVDKVEITINQSSPVEANLTANEFTADIALEPGANTILVRVLDQSGNATENQLVVTRVASPIPQTYTPASGSQIDAAAFTVNVVIDSALAADAYTLGLGGSQGVLASQDGNLHTWTLPNIPASFGNNAYTLTILSPAGSQQFAYNALYRPADYDVPQLVSSQPQDNALLQNQNFSLDLIFQTSVGAPMVTINNETVTPTAVSSTQFRASSVQSFADGGDSLSVAVAVTDILGGEAQQTLTFKRDLSAPEIVINNPFEVSPFINATEGDSVLLSGLITEANLAEATLNGEQLALTPLADGQWEFSQAITTPKQQERIITLRARDTSGNETLREYVVKNQTQTRITVLTPKAGTQYISDGENLIRVQIAATLEGFASGERVEFSSDGIKWLSANVANDFASSTVSLPPEAGSYTLQARVTTASGDFVIGQESVEVSSILKEDIPVSLASQSPKADSQYNPISSSIELHFAAELEQDKLSVSVTESVNGYTYITQDALGSDFLNTEGAELVQVNRDQEPVAGNLTLLPGARSAAFYPASPFAYGATIFVTVSYDGEELSRTQFKIRDLPTLVRGSVRDQIGQPVGGIRVRLKEAGRETTTNNDGAFSFGFQEPGDQIIPGGQYTLEMNTAGDAQLANQLFGNRVSKTVLKQGQLNDLRSFVVPERPRGATYSTLASGRKTALARGDFTLDLSSAQLSMPTSTTGKTRSSVSVSAQFMDFSEAGITIAGGPAPYWVYATYPQGVVLKGQPKLKIKIPKRNGSHAYFPAEIDYLVLLGYNAERGLLEPVGIGKVTDYVVESAGELALESLNYIAYTIFNAEDRDLVVDIAEGRASIEELKARYR